MNERIRELATQAGFEFWQDEQWNPGDLIDWSARYDDEFIKFAELLTQDVMELQKEKILELIESHIEQAIDIEGQRHLEWLKKAVEKTI